MQKKCNIKVYITRQKNMLVLLVLNFFKYFALNLNKLTHSNNVANLKKVLVNLNSFSENWVFKLTSTYFFDCLKMFIFD